MKSSELSAATHVLIGRYTSRLLRTYKALQAMVRREVKGIGPNPMKKFQFMDHFLIWTVMLASALNWFTLGDAVQRYTSSNEPVAPFKWALLLLNVAAGCYSGYTAVRMATRTAVRGQDLITLDVMHEAVELVDQSIALSKLAMAKAATAELTPDGEENVRKLIASEPLNKPEEVELEKLLREVPDATRSTAS